MKRYLDRVVVAADRLPNAESAAPFTVHLIDDAELNRAPQLRLDDILRMQVPGFSLFRRNSSRTANPTTQGVTLRNFAPSGAGRTLVLLDGIPLNDPFAGYVLWSQVPPAAIESVLVNPGGGAGLFGNVALAGTIFLVSEPMDATSVFVEGTIGNADTYEASLDATLSRDRLPRRFSRSGFRPAVIRCWRRNNAAASTITRALIPTFSISVANGKSARTHHSLCAGGGLMMTAGTARFLRATKRLAKTSARFSSKSFRRSKLSCS